ncbi:hypothetical protein EVAR_26556_1 [Eumeta japonica]|uniref:Uncharacterized protein n=1 Tax=Eumeta variegata TaxID=151549 RepID=A0A4C1W4X6_EUMVA|nr:hypothetical protein EVAR_26556_1 [Eumeta japonica]
MRIKSECQTIIRSASLEITRRINISSDEFGATWTSDSSPEKREEVAAVNQIATRQANTGSKYVKVAVKEDAGEEALGASLMQREKELREMHPVPYASRKLNAKNTRGKSDVGTALADLLRLSGGRHLLTATQAFGTSTSSSFLANNLYFSKERMM